MSTRPTVELITPRQREVLDLLAANRTNFEIAQELGISLDGAKWHVREVLARLGVDSREQAAEYWRHERSWARRAIAFLSPATSLATSKVVLFAIVATVGVAAAAGVIALRGGGDETPVSPGEATAVLTATEKVPAVQASGDLAPRTDIPVVDQVMAAIEKRDASALKGLVIATPERCTFSFLGTPGPRLLLCPPVEVQRPEDGILLDVERGLEDGKVHWLQGVDALIDRVVPEVRTFHGVSSAQSDGWDGFFAPWKYEVFAYGGSSGGQTWTVFLLNDDGIVGTVVSKTFEVSGRTGMVPPDSWLVAPLHIPRFEPDKDLYVLGRDTEIRFTAQLPPACASKPLAIRLYGYPDPGVPGGIQSMTEPGLSSEARAVADASGTTTVVFRLPTTISGPMVVRPGLLAPCLSGIAVQGELDLAILAPPDDADVAVIEYLGKGLDPDGASGESYGERLEALTARVGGVTCLTLPVGDAAPRNSRGNVEFRIGGPSQPAACSALGEPVVFFVASGVLEGTRMFEKPLFVPGVIQLIRNIGPDGISN